MLIAQDEKLPSSLQRWPHPRTLAKLAQSLTPHHHHQQKMQNYHHQQKMQTVILLARRMMEMSLAGEQQAPAEEKMMPLQAGQKPMKYVQEEQYPKSSGYDLPASAY